MKRLIFVTGLLFVYAGFLQAQQGKVAPKPLFRDPVFDGAADPVVIWNRQAKRWWMFYTNRRANVPGLNGVAWVHGTPIGLAESSDGGNSWKYLGVAKINDGSNAKEPTYWAPDVIDDGKTYHMFLTVVPGIFTDWNHPRSLVHLKSKDLRNWSEARPLSLSSDRVIDAAVTRLANGTWRLWYNNERDRKSIYYADSKDLESWDDKGKAVGDQGGEGPKVFHWHGTYWMITDVWRGLAVYKSEDASSWTRQDGPNLLEVPGEGLDDQVKGGHGEVFVTGKQAFLFYFTHPGRRGPDEKKDSTEQRRSSIQVVELVYENGRLNCDRNRPTTVRLRTK
jgi:hypothetical protein